MSLRPSNTQYLAAPEMTEVLRLLECLDGLEVVGPDEFLLRDTNGEVLGEVRKAEHGWGIWYPEPPDRSLLEQGSAE